MPLERDFLICFVSKIHPHIQRCGITLKDWRGLLFFLSFSPLQPLSESNLFSFWVTAGIWILDIANCYRGTFGLDVSHRAVLGLLFVNECDAGDHLSRTPVSRSPHCFLLDFNPAGEWTCTPVKGSTSSESCFRNERRDCHSADVNVRSGLPFVQLR